jgi:hypothetical protein
MERMSIQLAAAPITRRFAQRIRTTSTGGYTVINDSFETASMICNGESISRRSVRAAGVTIASLAFVGCLNFASTERVRAQEAQSVSCERKCTNVENKCHNDGGTDEMCAYDKKECLEKCSEPK